jgi:hypothetical protein
MPGSYQRPASAEARRAWPNVQYLSTGVDHIAGTAIFVNGVMEVKVPIPVATATPPAERKVEIVTPGEKKIIAQLKNPQCQSLFGRP